MGFLFGSSETKQELPAHIVDWQMRQMNALGTAAQGSPAIAHGPTVAAPHPALANYANAMAGAAGMPGLGLSGTQSGPGGGGQYLPQAQRVGGALGFSPFEGMQYNLQQQNEQFPGSLDALYSMFPYLAPEGYEYGQGGSQITGPLDWGTALSVEELVSQIQQMIEEYGPGGEVGAGSPGATVGQGTGSEGPDQGAGDTGTSGFSEGSEGGSPDPYGGAGI